MRSTRARRGTRPEAGSGKPSDRGRAGLHAPLQDLDRRQCWSATSSRSWPSWCSPSWPPSRERCGQGRQPGQRPGPGRRRVRRHVPRHPAVRPHPPDVVLVQPPEGPSGGNRSQEGRAFYKSVFGFIFGEGDPNQGWDEAERKYVIAYITVPQGRDHGGRAHGADRAGDATTANTLMNRLLLEYEGEPGVTDDGTVVYSFPGAHAHVGRRARIGPGADSQPVHQDDRPVLREQDRGPTAGSSSSTRSTSPSAPTSSGSASRRARPPWRGPARTCTRSSAACSCRQESSPVPVLAIVLGVIPVAFSVCFFLVPLAAEDPASDGTTMRSGRRRCGKR